MPITASENPTLLDVPDESGTGMPVFPEPISENLDRMSQNSGHRGSDSVPASTDSLSGFTIPAGIVDETRTAEVLPGFPGHGVEKNHSAYQAVDISAEIGSPQLDGRKSVDDSRTTISATGTAVYEAGTLTSLPVFPGPPRDGKSRTFFPDDAKIPAEPKMDGRKSTTAEDCDRAATALAGFPESSAAVVSLPPEHRHFPVAGNPAAAAFRAADFWQRTSPYVNDRTLLLAGAANLRHFDAAGFSSARSPEPGLAHRYGQPQPGANFLGGVVDFRRFPPENPAVTSPDSAILDTSPLSLARYQHK